MAIAEIFMSCQSPVARFWVGIGLMPSMEGTALASAAAAAAAEDVPPVTDEPEPPPMLMPAMLEPLLAALLEEALLVLSALAQPATRATVSPASTARRAVRVVCLFIRSLLSKAIS